VSNYSEKLKHPKWQKKRLKILKRDRFKCMACLSREKTLHIHHIKYLSNSEPWEVPNKYLISLCFECHKNEKNIDFDNLWKIRLKIRLIRFSNLIPDIVIDIIFKIFKLKEI
jgi:5-methylcytosine-specific restriction endonuclease McrA